MTLVATKMLDKMVQLGRYLICKSSLIVECMRVFLYKIIQNQLVQRVYYYKYFSIE